MSDRRPVLALPAFFFGGLLLASTSFGAELIALEGTSWSVRVDPASLSVTAKLNSGGEVVIASAQPGVRRVTDLVRAERRRASWALPEANVLVEMAVEGDVLSVGFRAAGAGAAEFAWPVIDAAAAPRAYVLPMFEGLYVPAEDAEWGTFLAAESPMSTTAGLSMPFWGVDVGGRTLTYILTNPFNNELSFAHAGGRTTLKLAHAFTANGAAREFGYRIYLGDGSPVAPAKRYRKYLVDEGRFVGLKEKIATTPDAAKLLGAAHVYVWGDGASETMVQALADAGLDRLWLGSPNWDGLAKNPDAVRRAVELGYLIGPYDSFHSIHSPNEKDTWETAQFDAGLYESGAIVNADGTKRKGFKQKGHLLSPAAARPHVEKRVAGLMAAFRCNSWFVDCDAFGDVFDDYSKDHPATQAQDAAERVARMAWIRDAYGAVIGSEGGAAYAAGVVHFAHGVMTPVVAWVDPDLKARGSKYFLGGYWPPEGPAVFFKRVPMKPEHRRVYADPRFRVPLYQTVFHDSVVATHQWGYGSLKFEDEGRTRELLELLYNVPPLYHLNSAEWKKRRAEIVRHYEAFSPMHREAGVWAMTDFAWLTADRMVQRTRFGEGLEVVVNFGGEAYRQGGVEVGPHAMVARWLKSGKTVVFPEGTSK